MKLTGKSIPRKSKNSLIIQGVLALVLALSPTMIYGYNPPRGQKPPRAPSGGSSFLPIEIGEISPLSL